MRIKVLTSKHSSIHKDMEGEAKPMGQHGYEVTFLKVKTFLGDEREATIYMLKSEVEIISDGLS